MGYFTKYTRSFRLVIAIDLLIINARSRKPLIFKLR